ncbi:MAG: VWA domain-containing protein [Deltaproteobacteria bacterium]|nr:MAG: VWA domain-containing protein [Deltaproteobacteria bacterium]
MLFFLAITAHAMDLVEVRYEVAVDGPLAEVVVAQTFENRSGRPIEEVYAFPLHEQAAVDGMRIEIGTRIVQGEVHERQRATAAYDQAVAQGHTAALTTQDRPNLFAQRVGNIPPGEKVTVRMRVVQPVPYVDGEYELVLPLVAGPRFVSTARYDRGEPLFAQPLAGPTHASIDVEIASAVPFVRFESSHELDLAASGDTAWAQTAEVPLDRDFTLRWQVASEQPQAGLYVDEGHALIALEPPPAVPRHREVPREWIFVIDQSGSMSGQPMALVKQAAQALLDTADGRDSLRIVRFGSTVEADLRAHPLVPETQARARATLDALAPGGGTYLLEGVREALRTRDDPIRERTIVFMSDGLIADERAVLATIADELVDARLFVLAVGPLPNRWLLAEMARFGGGLAAWIEPGDDPRAVVEDFVDRIDEPVLTDISVDWGDWEVDGPWPSRLPALYAGQPLLTGARVRRQGTTPVAVRGWTGEGPFEALLTPVDAASERSVASTWARQTIAELERDQVWGDTPELAARILDTSLEYQVLSRYTAFLAIAEGEIERQAEMAKRRVIKTRQSLSHDDVIEVVAKRRAVDVEAVEAGTVLTREVLQRIPAGRDYQSAVQIAAGVSSNPNLGSSASNENTYLLDGVSITDPVTGTFSLNFNFDGIEQVDVFTAGIPVEVPGATRVVEVVTRSGTNRLEASAEVSQGLRSDPSLRVGYGGLAVGGPLIRDRMWLRGTYHFDHSAIAGRQFSGHRGTAKLTTQLNAAHRLSLTGAFDLAEVRGDVDVHQDSGLGTFRWQWFMSPDANVQTSASVQRLVLDDEWRTRRQLRTGLVAFVGKHDLGFGADLEDLSWKLDAARAESWLGIPVAAQGGSTRVGLYASENWVLGRGFVRGGVRTDLTLGRAHVAPQLYVGLNPTHKSKLALGAARRFGHLGLVSAEVAPELGLSRVDEVLALAEAELAEDLALSLSGTWRDHSRIPAVGGTRTRLSALASEVVLRKVQSRRWFAEISWRTVHRMVEPGETLLYDGSLDAFRHRLRGVATWDLPTEPWRVRLGVSGSVSAVPLGVVRPDPVTGVIPNDGRWTGGVRLSQGVDLRRRRQLWLDLEGQYFSLLDNVPRGTWIAAQRALPLVRGYEGLRWQATVRFEL